MSVNFNSRNTFNVPSLNQNLRGNEIFTDPKFKMSCDRARTRMESRCTAFSKKVRKLRTKKIFEVAEKISRSATKQCTQLKLNDRLLSELNKKYPLKSKKRVKINFENGASIQFTPDELSRKLSYSIYKSALRFEENCAKSFEIAKVISLKTLKKNLLSTEKAHIKAKNAQSALKLIENRSLLMIKNLKNDLDKSKINSIPSLQLKQNAMLAVECLENVHKERKKVVKWVKKTHDSLKRTQKIKKTLEKDVGSRPGDSIIQNYFPSMILRS